VKTVKCVIEVKSTYTLLLEFDKCVQKALCVASEGFLFQMYIYKAKTLFDIWSIMKLPDGQIEQKTLSGNKMNKEYSVMLNNETKHIISDEEIEDFLLHSVERNEAEECLGFMSRYFK
jgi:hypothetical protein